MHTATDACKRLVGAARSLVAASSYHAAGAQAICGRAGVQKGSFRHDFTARRVLAPAAVDDVAGYFCRRVFEHAFSTDSHPLARIERFFTTVYTDHQQVRDTTGQTGDTP